MDTIKANNLYLLHDINSNKYKFYVGNDASVNLVDLANKTLIRKEFRKQLEEDNLLFKVWIVCVKVEENIGAKLNTKIPFLVKKEMAKSLISEDYINMCDKVTCDITHVKYSVSHLINIENKLNNEKGFEL